MTATLLSARPGTRVRGRAALTVLALTATLAAASGCSALSSAHNLVDNAGLLSSMASKVTKAQKATFQATYAITGNGDVTVAQKPPASAFVSKTKRLITTERYTFLCDVGNGQPLCQRSPVDTGSVDPSDDLGVTGFVSGELALGVLSAAMIIPKAHVTKSSETIAGQRTTCVTVSGLDKLDQGDSSGSGLSNFVVCITDGGVLAKFSGHLTDGTKGDVTLTRFSTSVDSGLLKPPAGAKITS